jgi:uncharacterized alkaline shock family protein YloU
VTDATLGTDGVYEFSGNLGDTLSRNFLGKESRYKGVKIDDNEKGYCIDLYVIVEYGIKIPEVAWNIQRNVKSRLEEVMDIEIENINIHVQGVHRGESTVPTLSSEGGLDA